MALVGHWKLDGNANDSSGNGYDGTPVDVTYANGKIGQAGSFNGTTSRINSGSVYTVGNLDVSVSAWVYPTTLSGSRTIVSNSAGANNFTFFSGNGGSLWLITNDGTFGMIGPGEITPINTWSHVAFTRSGTSGILYVNGVATSGESVPGNIGNPVDWFIGGVYDNTTLWAGSIDEVRVYDHALSPREVIELSKAKILHYGFDDIQQPGIGEVSTISDSSGFGNNGEIAYATAPTWVADSKVGAGAYVFNTLHREVTTDVDNLTAVGGFFSEPSNAWYVIFSQKGNVLIWYGEVAATTVPVPSPAQLSGRTIDATYKVEGPFLFNSEVWSKTVTALASAPEFSSVTTTASGVRFIHDGVKEVDLAAGVVTDAAQWDTVEINITSNTTVLEDVITTPNGDEYFAGVGQLSTSLWYKTDNQDLIGISLILCDLANYKWIGAYLTTLSSALMCYVRTATDVYSASYGSSPAILADGQWHHVVMTYNRHLPSQRLKLYFDGGLVATTDGVDEDILPSTEDIVIGRFGGSYFDGFMDDVRVYAEALSLTDIQELYKLRSSIDKSGSLWVHGVDESGIATSVTGKGVFKAPSISEVGPTDGLVAYYPLDGNSTDVSGNGNDGTDTAVTYVAGKAGQAGSFNGESIGSKIAFNCPALGTAYSVTMWVRANPTGAATQALMDSAYGSSLILLELSNLQPAFTFYLLDFGFGLTFMSPVEDALIAEQWYHLAFVHTGATGFIYINGIQSASTNYASSDILAVTRHLGGYGSGSGNSLDGLMDEVRIYNRALSVAEINVLHEVDKVKFSGGVGVTSGLVAYYPLDGSSTDASGNGNNGTPTDVTYVVGKVGQAGSFNGITSGSRIQFSCPALGTAYSIAMWVKANSTGEIEQILMASGFSSSIIILQLSDFRPMFTFYTTASGGIAITFVSPVGDALVPDQWYHLVFSHTGTTGLIYINGVQSANSNYVSSDVGALTREIGGYSGAGYGTSLDGLIDEVRIYNRALTEEEVSTLYNNTNFTSHVPKLVEGL